MAQSFTLKQQQFIQRFSSASVALMAAVDAMQALAAEFASDAYGTGGANALTDAVVQGVLPAATALQVAEAVGTINGANQLLSIAGQGSSGRAYLEMMRP